MRARVRVRVRCCGWSWIGAAGDHVWLCGVVVVCGSGWVRVVLPSGSWLALWVWVTVWLYVSYVVVHVGVYVLVCGCAWFCVVGGGFRGRGSLSAVLDRCK